MQEMLGLCDARNGTEFDELLQAGASRHKRVRQDVKTNSAPGRWHGPCQRGKHLENRRRKEKNHEKSVSRLLGKFEMEGFMAQKGLWNLARENMLQDRGALPEEEGDVIREFFGWRCMQFFLS